jgi:hypothetical protein
MFFRIPCRGIGVFRRGSASGKEASFIFLFAARLTTIGNINIL